MVKCSFCGEEIEKGRGLIYVRKDAGVLNFCSKKCGKNMVKLKRSPLTTKWTKKYGGRGVKV